MSTPEPNTLRQKLARIHPLLILPIVGTAAWLAADLLPGVSKSMTAKGQTGSKAAAMAPQSFASTLPAQMPATLFAAPQANPGVQTAYASPGGSAAASGSGSGPGNGRKSEHIPSGRSVATDPPRHHRGDFADSGLANPRRHYSAGMSSSPTPRTQSRVATMAPAAPRVMSPAPMPIYRPAPVFRGFAGGGFHGGGGHSGGHR